MGTVGHEVRTWLDASHLTAAGMALRAGVSTSTVYRILHDHVDPTFATLREIGLACGIDLQLTASIPSDPDAAAAARCLLEAGYIAPPSTGVSQWEQRLPRLATTDHPLALVKTAATFSAPLHRPGAYLFDGEVSISRLASAGSASQGAWALSGAAGLALPTHTEPTPDVTFLWCEHPRTVAQLLTDSPLIPTKRTDHARIVVVAAEPELFHDTFTHGILTYTAPIQIIIDCISLGGTLADKAMAEAQTW